MYIVIRLQYIRDYSMLDFKPSPQKPLLFFKQCSAYQASLTTRIHTSSGTEVLVKHEGNRMGLGSFKGLGGIYAVAQLISDQWEVIHGSPLEPSELLSSPVREMAQSISFVCASAGNHGLAVAAGARLLGASSTVYLSQAVPDNFEKALLAQGAFVIRSGNTYEESMAAAMADANSTGAILLADSSWPGYEYPPSLIMEGYTVIAEELKKEFERDVNWPSHVYLQAGVGGFAGAITYMIRHNWPVQPIIYIVEPEFAPCLKASHEAGKPVNVAGPISTMGRLDCKEPSIIAFNILQISQVNYITVSDKDADDATHKLHKNGLSTTPSGAAGFAALLKTETLHTAQANQAFKPMIFVTENANTCIE